MTTNDIIDSDVLQEILDDRDRRLQEQFHHMLMGAMVQMQGKPQQPIRSADDLLWKALADAVSEGGHRVENRLVAIIADFAAKNNKTKGEDIYQYLNLAYQRLM
jgi:hypothetical protein